MSKQLTPPPDRILAIPTEGETKTAGGLLIPPGSAKKTQLAEVYAVGSNIDWINAGDMVLHVEFGPDKYEYDGKEYLILREDDVLALEVNNG